MTILSGHTHLGRRGYILVLSDDVSQFRRHFFPLLFMVVGIAIVYSNSLHGSFMFDDQQILDRPNLHITDLSVHSLIGTMHFTPDGKKIYRPLSHLTIGFNYFLGMDDPFGYHIFNIVIHILCSLAVYLFLQTLLSIPGIKPIFAAENKYTISIIATLLFALHPIQTNVATYIIQRMASLVALFYIISVTGYMQFRLGTLPENRQSKLKTYLSLFICLFSAVLAILSKENAVTLPVILLVLDYLLFYPITKKNDCKKIRLIYIAIVFFIACVSAYFFPKYLIQSLSGYQSRNFTLNERLLTEARIVFFYVYLLVIPNQNVLNLNHDYSLSYSFINPPQTIISIIGIIFLLILLFKIRKRYNLFSFVIAWYFVNLSIESTVIPLELVFEHRTYIPGVLIFFMVALGIVYVSKKIKKEWVMLVFTSFLLILYGNGTYLRNYVFTTPISMWQDVVLKSPHLARAHSNLGRAYMENGDYLKAKKELEIAIKLDPKPIVPLNNLAKLYMNQFDRNDIALRLFRKAMGLEPESAYPCKGLGDVYYKMKNYPKAEHFYTVAVKRMRFLTSAINNLAITKIYLNKKKEALAVFKYGIKLDPANAELNTNIAKLYSDLGLFDQAIKVLEAFLDKNRKFKPGYELLKKIKNQQLSSKTTEKIS